MEREMKQTTWLSMIAVALTAVWLGTYEVRADPASMTEQVLDRHLAAFGSGDVDAILANYARDAVVLVPGATMRGHDEIRSMFEGLTEEFGQEGVKFELTHKAVNGRIAFIAWTAETGKAIYELGTDTYLIRRGKIVTQTVAAKTTSK